MDRKALATIKHKMGDVMTNREKDYFIALYEVARVINASLEPAEVLEKIACCVTEAMGVKACSIRLLDARGTRLLMGAACGLSKGYLVKGPVLVKESGIDRKALGGATPSRTRDSSTPRRRRRRRSDPSSWCPSSWAGRP